MTQTIKRARGLWFDEPRKKWRVRLYRNGKAFSPEPQAYFDTEEEAIAAYEALKNKLNEIPKRRRAVNTDVDLASLWKQCVGAAGHYRIRLNISAENV